MADLAKVIKGFECCHVMVHDLGPDKTSCGICPYKNVQTEEQINLGGIECIAVLHDDALALLKEQNPVEPKLVGVNTWTCGECGALLGWDEFSRSGLELVKYKYCPGCGRAVKWE